MASLHWQLYPNFTLYSCLKNCRKVICSEIKGWLSCYFGVATISLGVAWKTPCEQVPPSHSFSFISPVFQQNCSYARFCLCFECGMLIEQKVGVAGRSGEVQKWTRWGPSLLSFVSLGKQKLTTWESRKPKLKEVMPLAKAHTAQRGQNPVPTGPTGSQARVLCLCSFSSCMHSIQHSRKGGRKK